MYTVYTNILSIFGINCVCGTAVVLQVALCKNVRVLYRYNEAITMSAFQSAPRRRGSWSSVWTCVSSLQHSLQSISGSFRVSLACVLVGLAFFWGFFLTKIRAHTLIFFFPLDKLSKLNWRFTPNLQISSTPVFQNTENNLLNGV